MIVYRYKHNCYKCGEEMFSYTYLHYRCFYGDVEFPYPDWMMYEVYAEINPDNPYLDKNSYSLNFPVKMLGGDKELDCYLISNGYDKYIKKIYSKESNAEYYANICPHCGSFQGRYYLQCDITDIYLKPNLSPDIDAII